MDDGVGWLHDRFVVLLLHVSRNVGRVGLQWKTRNPTSAVLNLNSLGVSSLHHPVGRDTHDSGEHVGSPRQIARGGGARSQGVAVGPKETCGGENTTLLQGWAKVLMEEKEECLDRRENKKHVRAQVLCGERSLPGFSADGQDLSVLTQPFLGAVWKERVGGRGRGVGERESERKRAVQGWGGWGRGRGGGARGLEEESGVGRGRESGGGAEGYWGEMQGGGGRGEGLQGVEADLSSHLLTLSYSCPAALWESPVWRTLVRLQYDRHCGVSQYRHSFH